MENNTVKPGRGWRRFRNISILVLVVGLAAFIGIRFYYPFGVGTKTGQLNYFVYKGIIFKTYEGKLIQSGFRTTTASGIASNEFEFSVKDKAIADSLMHIGGQVVELRYKEYFGALPWRGYSKFIVDEIVRVTPVSTAPGGELPVILPE